MRIKTKDLKAYNKSYYLEHRETILNRSRASYKRKGNNKCKGCGDDIKELQEANNFNFGYCNKCMADKTKTSRQARWYRKNRFRLQFERKVKKQMGVTK